MSNYLHGAETTEENAINLIISDADISSVVVIGTKPTYLLDNPQTIEKVTNYQEISKYLGVNLDGFTLPDAAETILKESDGADIYTINIYDNDKHASIVEKTLQFYNDEQVLKELGIQELELKQDGNTLILDEDYTFENNTIKISDRIFEGVRSSAPALITAKYKYTDLSKIQDSDIIGGIDKDGKRSGIQLIDDIIATYGITPGIIIAPGFVSKNVRNAIEEMADKIGAFAFLDCDKEVNVVSAEKQRLRETDGIDLTTTSERTMLLAPWVERYNSYQNTQTLKPLSPVAAGLRVRLDRDRNVGKSIDNTVSKTIKKTQFPISFKLDRPDTDSNRLNAKGITTVINHKGSYYLWGARNASFPSKDGIMTFESARRTRDFIHKSIEDMEFTCVGESITQGFIDDVLNAINSKFAAWSNPLDRKNQIMYEGEAYWDKNLNTAESLASGHIRFPFKWCPLCVAERITNEDILDITIITKVLNS